MVVVVVPVNKQIFWLTIIICTPIGWMWNWWHYYSGVSPAWGFPLGQVIGFEILGVPIEDWVFYPITGGFFVTMYFLDPLKRVINFKRSSWWLKFTLFIVLIHLIIFGWLVFGRSGTVTAFCFGLPSVFLFLAIYKTWDTEHFIRTFIIVVPTNVVWDIWATPGQWYYNAEVFSPHFWYLNIPAEMTPYLGIMAAYFVFGVVTCLKKYLH
jgi:hypothetical protein